MESVHPGVFRGQQLALVHVLQLLVELQLALFLRYAFLGTALRLKSHVNMKGIRKRKHRSQPVAALLRGCGHEIAGGGRGAGQHGLP